MTPELVLVAEGQPVQLRAASSVQLGGALREEIVPGDSRLEASDNGERLPDGTLRYRGLADGDLATVLGEKGNGGGVAPQHLFAGDRAAFAESQRQAASNLLISGICALIMAPIVLIGGLLAAVTWRRR